jgi:hypothetical protein
MEVVESRFLEAIDAAVEQVLPSGWPRLPREWLPAHGSLRARHAFRLAPGEGGARAAAGPGGGTEAVRAPYLAIVAAPPFAARTPATQAELAALVDRIIARGASVLLLFEHEDDPDGWIREHICFPHPRFLGLGCSPPGAADGGAADALAYTVKPTDTDDHRETLAAAIHGLWSGQLRYRGPCEGSQTIGVEIMADECWRCRRAISTVTGIVFPDREVTDWSRLDWAYYRQLLELARIPDAMIPELSAAVDGWRAAGASQVTLIRWRFSNTVSHAYWAAECPFCGNFRGDFFVMEERQGRLHDLEVRRLGVLSYRPLPLDVPREALQELTWGFEISPHSRSFGWYREGDPEAARPETRAYRMVMTNRDSQAAPAALAALRADLASGALAARARLAAPAPLALAAGDGTPAGSACGSFEGRGTVPAPAGSDGEPRTLRRLGQILTSWLGSPRRVP